jgi:hypothetical protein
MAALLPQQVEIKGQNSVFYSWRNGFECFKILKKLESSFYRFSKWQRFSKWLKNWSLHHKSVSFELFCVVVFFWLV